MQFENNFQDTDTPTNTRMHLIDCFTWNRRQLWTDGGGESCSYTRRWVRRGSWPARRRHCRRRTDNCPCRGATRSQHAPARPRPTTPPSSRTKTLSAPDFRSRDTPVWRHRPRPPWRQHTTARRQSLWELRERQRQTAVLSTWLL